MAVLPQAPSMTGFNTPSRNEAVIADPAYDGTVPVTIQAAFYRVQPDPQFPPLPGKDLAFNSVGLISRFHIGRPFSGG
jgi:carotenoid cleavage dioxygenase